MDTLSHAASGVLLGRAGARAPTAAGPGINSRLFAAGLGAVLPDSDFLLRLADTLTYLNWHQGPTHSLLLLPLWAFLPALLVARFISWRERRRCRWQAFYLPACLGIFIHIAGDALTAYGPMLAWPVSEQRFYLPWLYLLDPVFTLLVAAGLIGLFCLPRPRLVAILALLLLAGYVGWQGWLHHQAASVGQDYARAERLAAAEVHALPQPPGPFHWKVLVRDGDTYHETWIHLRREQAVTPSEHADLLQRIDAAFSPATDPNWQLHSLFGHRRAALVREAWQDPSMAPFRRFALFPALAEIEQTGQTLCLWFVDRRFTLPALPASFRFGACRQSDGGQWRLERRRGAFWID